MIDTSVEIRLELIEDDLEKAAVIGKVVGFSPLDFLQGLVFFWDAISAEAPAYPQPKTAESYHRAEVDEVEKSCLAKKSEKGGWMKQFSSSKSVPAHQKMKLDTKSKKRKLAKAGPGVACSGDKRSLTDNLVSWYPSPCNSSPCCSSSCSSSTSSTSSPSPYFWWSCTDHCWYR